MLAAIGIASPAQGRPLGLPKLEVSERYVSQATSNPEQPNDKPVQSAVQSDSTQRDDRKNDGDQANDTEAFLTWFTGALVVVGIIQAIILGFTVAAIKNQTASAENTKRAWVMADIDWDRKKVAAGTVFRGSGSSGDSTAIYLILSCKNEGESPAWIYEKRATFEITKSLPSEPNLTATEFLQVATEPIGTGKGALPHTTELHWDSLAKGHQQTGEMMVIYGMVKYRDIFNKPRTTRFAYRITPDMKFIRLENYPKYNENT